jgi:hypothetical protein
MKSGIFEVQRWENMADSDPRLQLNPFINKDFLRVLGQSYTGIFTGLAARSETGLCSDTARLTGFAQFYPMHFRGGRQN